MGEKECLLLYQRTRVQILVHPASLSDFQGTCTFAHLSARARTHLHTHVHTHTYTHTLVHTYTCTCTYTLAHTHTYTHTIFFFKFCHIFCLSTEPVLRVTVWNLATPPPPWSSCPAWTPYLTCPGHQFSAFFVSESQAPSSHPESPSWDQCMAQPSRSVLET